jgi:hypothetical protein
MRIKSPDFRIRGSRFRTAKMKAIVSIGLKIMITAPGREELKTAGIEDTPDWVGNELGDGKNAKARHTIHG